MMIDAAFEDPVFYFTWIGLVVVSVVLHELGHGLTATWQGDPTPRMTGHLTWNPLVHMGWMMLLMLAIVGITGGSTPVNARYFRNRRWGDFFVSAAGPGVNLVLAVLSGILVGVAVPWSGVSQDIPIAELPLGLQTLYLAAMLNFALFLFNLLPVPPLDGFRVAESVFDLGPLGQFLRAVSPLPLIAAFVFASQFVFGIARAMTGVVVLAGHTVFHGVG